MKRCRVRSLALVALTGGVMALSSCQADGARFYGSAAIHYGPFDFWFYDRPWLDGWPWWHGAIVIQPPPIYIGRPHRGPHVPDRPRVFHGR